MLEQWNKDPEFQALPDAQKGEILSNYFNTEMVDDEFHALSEDEQSDIRNNFLSSEGFALPEPSLQIATPLKEGVKDVARNIVQTSLGSEQARDTEAEAKKFGQPQLQSLMTPGMMQEIAQGQSEGVSPEQALETSRQDRVKQLEGTVEDLKPDETYERSEGWRGWVEDFIRTSPQIGTQVAATIATGPVGGIGMMGTQIMGGTYENLVEQGVEPEKALNAGLANAVMQAPLEQIGLNKVMAVWKPQKAIIQKLKAIATGAGAEWLTEFVQAYPDMMVNIVATNPDKTKLEQAEKMVDELWETTKQGMYEGTLTAPWALLGIAAPTASTSNVGPRDVAADRDVEETQISEGIDAEDIVEQYPDYTGEIQEQQRREQEKQKLTATQDYEKRVQQQAEIDKVGLGDRVYDTQLANQQAMDDPTLQTQQSVESEIRNNEIARDQLAQEAATRKESVRKIIGDDSALKSLFMKSVIKGIKDRQNIDVAEGEAEQIFNESSSDFQDGMNRIFLKSWAQELKSEPASEGTTQAEDDTETFIEKIKKDGKSDLTYIEQVEVETGQVLTLERDAAEVIGEIDTEMDTLNKVLDCLG